jgi:hypothetical protein
MIAVANLKVAALNLKRFWLFLLSHFTQPSICPAQRGTSANFAEASLSGTCGGNYVANRYPDARTQEKVKALLGYGEQVPKSVV